MTPATYQAALTTLGLTTTQAADWLGVSVRTAQRYAKTGPCGPAARAIQMRLNDHHMSRTFDYLGPYSKSAAELVFASPFVREVTEDEMAELMKDAK